MPASNAVPAGFTAVTPHLVVDGAADAIDFYARAFGAEEACRMPADDGRRLMHAEIRINGAPIMLADDFPEYCGGKSRAPGTLGGTPVTIHLYVDDCDAWVRRAEQAGATVNMPPQDMFWGDRYASLTDPFGHQWSIATHLRDLTPEEMQAAAKAAFGGG